LTRLCRIGLHGKENAMEDCIFCKIVAGDIPCVRVFEDDQVLSFADINPISDGHTLIIPKNHHENIWEIPADTLGAIHAAAKKIADAMKTSLGPAGIALLQLNGRAVNQIVMHYHLHLIPRRADAPELTMTAWELKPGDMDAIKANAAKITAAL
jgi:histidine triad (HIT) family protein